MFSKAITASETKTERVKVSLMRMSAWAKSGRLKGLNCSTKARAFVIGSVASSCGARSAVIMPFILRVTMTFRK